MQERVFVAETGGTESQVLDDTGRRLSMNGVSVCQGVLETCDDTVDVVLAHLPNVLEEEGHGLQASVADVQVWCTVLVQNGGNAGERTARFLRNGN